MSLRDVYGSTVRCYGCGGSYDANPQTSRAAGPSATNVHTHHFGINDGMTREQILGMLDRCQAERDDWLRIAFGAEG